MIIFSKWLDSSIWPIDGTLTVTTNQDQSGPGSNSNKEVLPIPQSSRTEVSPSDWLVLYLGHSLRKLYLSAEMQLVFSTAPDWGIL